MRASLFPYSLHCLVLLCSCNFDLSLLFQSHSLSILHISLTSDKEKDNLEEMDPSMLFMLSNLLHFHNHLDPTLSLLSSSPSPTDPTLSSSTAPLLFFAIASVLSYVSSTLTQSNSSPSPSPSPPPRPPPRTSSSFFLSLSSDCIWSMDPAARDAKWRSQYGLSYPVFATLLDHLRPHLSPSHLPVPTDHALSIVLCRLSHGISSRSLSQYLSLPPLISHVTHAVTRLLSTHLYPDYVKTPISHHLLQTISSFKDLTAPPNCCGFIASSPVRFRLPPFFDCDFESLLSPNRSFPSILLQVVFDHRKIFWDACVKAPGSSNPASHFRNSSVYDRLSSSKILRDSVISVHGHHVRPYIVGDSSYPLLPYILTPFGGGPSNTTATTSAQEAFNEATSKGRATSVEGAIALLKGRWKILRNLNVGLDHAAQTVVACVVLHNMCQIAGEPEDDGKYLWRDPPESLQPMSPVENEHSLSYAGESLRQALAGDLYERQQRLSGVGSR